MRFIRIGAFHGTLEPASMREAGWDAGREPEVQFAPMPESTMRTPAKARRMAKMARSARMGTR